MRTPVRAMIAASVVLALPPLAAVPALATVDAELAQPAVFVMTDDLEANTVVAYTRHADGTLTEAGSYPTGGRGGILDGAVVDNTASQGSLAIDRINDLVYAVNPGSNTITVFSVHGDRLQREQVLPSGGEFPVSITTYGNLVYVLNARDGGAIQGYLRRGSTLEAVPAWNRALGLDTAQEPEFLSTPSQVAFTPRGTRLLVTTKASSTIEVFKIDIHGGPSREAVSNELPGRVPFAVAFDTRGRAVVAEAGTSSVAVFRLQRGRTLDLVSRTPTGQEATCWITASGRKLYASNTGSSTLSGFRVSRDGVLTELGQTDTHEGTIDSAVTPDGDFLYVQTGAEGRVDQFQVRRDGSLVEIGSVTVPDAVGGEGIVTT